MGTLDFLNSDDHNAHKELQLSEEKKKNQISLKNSNDEQILYSQEEINKITNKLKKKAFIKRNEIIKKANDQYFKVISDYKTSEHSLMLKCQKNHIFKIIPGNINFFLLSNKSFIQIWLGRRRG